MNGKKWYKSKTLYFGNGLAALGVAILALPELREWVFSLQSGWQPVALIAIGLLSDYLRLVTKKPIEW